MRRTLFLVPLKTGRRQKRPRPLLSISSLFLLSLSLLSYDDFRPRRFARTMRPLDLTLGNITPSYHLFKRSRRKFSRRRLARARLLAAADDIKDRRRCEFLRRLWRGEGRAGSEEGQRLRISQFDVHYWGVSLVKHKNYAQKKWPPLARGMETDKLDSYKLQPSTSIPIIHV